jgi:hypothetical protein
MFGESAARRGDLGRVSLVRLVHGGPALRSHGSGRLHAGQKLHPKMCEGFQLWPNPWNGLATGRPSAGGPIRGDARGFGWLRSATGGRGV